MIENVRRKIIERSFRVNEWFKKMSSENVCISKKWLEIKKKLLKLKLNFLLSFRTSFESFYWVKMKGWKKKIMWNGLEIRMDLVMHLCRMKKCLASNEKKNKFAHNFKWRERGSLEIPPMVVVWLFTKKYMWREKLVRQKFCAFHYDRIVIFLS